MCYQTESGWVCCYCKKYENKLADMTCKGCDHSRCATFGESDTLPPKEIKENLVTIDIRSAYPIKIQTNSMYGQVGPSRKLLGLPTQYEQAKATVGLLLRAPIQDREFLIGIWTLERILAMAQNPEASGDDSITKDAWEKLSAFLKTCRTINEQGCHVDGLFRP